MTTGNPSRPSATAASRYELVFVRKGEIKSVTKEEKLILAALGSIVLLALIIYSTRPFSWPLIVGAYVLSGPALWVKERIQDRLAHRNARQAP